jgi:hypothetical protein
MFIDGMGNDTYVQETCTDLARCIHYGESKFDGYTIPQVRSALEFAKRHGWKIKIENEK